MLEEKNFGGRNRQKFKKAAEHFIHFNASYHLCFEKKQQNGAYINKQQQQKQIK